MDHGRARRRRSDCVRRALICTAPLLFVASLAQAQIIQVSDGDLAQLSLEELGDIEVTSVSKRPEPLNEAPTSIYVLTHDDIARTGAVRLPEVLRFAPNLQVAQTSASRYAISARGMNGAQQAQNFSNKLLVMIDGRSVYTPLYSGVYWDMQDVLLQDTDRIEVISGPGATLWGANAVNGVINITSRNSAETQGLLFQAGGGHQERVGALRYGGRLSDSLSFRVYGRILSAGDTDTPAGVQGHDHWTRRQAGFRADWSPSAADAVTLQGDIYNGALAQPGAAAERIDGANLVARWSHSFADGSNLQLKAYYDHADRGFWVDTYDIDGQYGFSLGSRNEVVVGGGYRTYKYFIGPSPIIYFTPSGQTLHLANAFVQDRISLTSNLKLTLGIKLEDNPYIKATLLPNARLSYSPSDRLTLWAAASRAIRSATPFDREVVEQPAGTPFLVGGPNFRSEKLIAYETGARALVSPKVSVSLAAYYNEYDDLRSIEATPGTIIPLYWGNELRGHTYGAELWGDVQLTSWWRLSPALTYHDQKFSFRPGGGPKLVGVEQVSNDPKWQGQLKSSMTAGRLTADAMLRYVSAMPDPRIPAYTELSARIGYAITDEVQISLSGRNLLHRRHVEYVEGAAIPRSVMADIQWRF